MTCSLTLALSPPSDPDSNTHRFHDNSDEIFLSTLLNFLVGKLLIYDEFMILHDVKNYVLINRRFDSGRTALPAFILNGTGVNNCNSQYKDVNGFFLKKLLRYWRLHHNTREIAACSQQKFDLVGRDFRTKTSNRILLLWVNVEQNFQINCSSTHSHPFHALCNDDIHSTIQQYQLCNPWNSCFLKALFL